MQFGVPTRKAYLEIFEGDAASVKAYLAVLAHIRIKLEALANYIKRLPADKLNEVLEIIIKKIKIIHKIMNISPVSEILFVPLRYIIKERMRYE